MLQSTELQTQLSVILSEESVWIIQYNFISQVTKDRFTEAKESSFSLNNFNYHLPNLLSFTILSKEKKKKIWNPGPGNDSLAEVLQA